MNKKLIIVIFLIIVIIFGIVIFKTNKVKDETQVDNEYSENDIKYDEETGLYYIKDEETGEIISASKDEAYLKIYIDNPDYNPNPLTQKSTSLQDFINSEELNEIESLEQQ